MQDDAGVLLSQLVEAKESGNEHVMVGICEEMCTLLCIGSEEHLRAVDAGKFVKILVEVLEMETAILELKVFTMRAVALVIDMIPRSGGAAVSCGIIPVVIQQLGEQHTSAQYGEELLKALETLSLDYSREMLTADAMPILIRWLTGISENRDRVHNKILSILANISSRLRTCDFPRVGMLLPTLSCIIRAAGERRVESVVDREGLDFTISKICLTIAHLVDRLGTVDGLFAGFAAHGMIPALLETIDPGCNLDDVLSTASPVAAAPQKHTSPAHRSFVLRTLSVIYTANPHQGVHIFADNDVILTVSGLITRCISSQPCSPRITTDPEAPHTPQLFKDEASVSGVLDFLSLILPAAPESPLVDPGIVAPFHMWSWEDDYHNLSSFDDVICQRIEAEYSRQRSAGALRNVDIVAGGRSYTVNFADMTQCSKATKVMRAVYRDPIPSHYVGWKETHEPQPGRESRWRTNQVVPLGEWDDEPTEEQTEDGGCLTGVFRRWGLGCFGKGSDEETVSSDRRVIDSVPGDDNEMTEVGPVGELHLIASSPSLLRQLLSYCLPSLTTLLSSTVNPLLLRDAMLTTVRLLEAYLQYMKVDPAPTEEFSAILSGMASKLSQAIVMVASTSADFSPLVVIDFTKHVAGQLDPLLSCYGQTLAAGIVLVRLLLEAGCGGVYKTWLQRAGVRDMLVKSGSLCAVLKKRGQQCCSQATEDQHSCKAVELLDDIKKESVSTEEALGPVVSVHTAIQTLNERVETAERDGTDVLSIIASTIKSDGITGYELMHPACQAIRCLHGYILKVQFLRDGVTQGIPLELKQNPVVLRRVLSTLQQGLGYHLMQAAVNPSIGGLKGVQKEGKLQPAAPVSVPLGVSVSTAGYVTAVLNAVQERLGRPVSIRCVGEGEDMAVTVTAYPFVTFGCLERWIVAKYENSRAVSPSNSPDDPTKPAGRRRQSDSASVRSFHTNNTSNARPSVPPMDDVEVITPDTEIPQTLEFTIDGHLVPNKRITLIEAIMQYSHAGATMRRIIATCGTDSTESKPAGKSHLGKALAMWNSTVAVTWKRVNGVGGWGWDERPRVREGGVVGVALTIQGVLGEVEREERGGGEKQYSSLIHDLYGNVVPVAIPVLGPLLDVATDPRRDTRILMQTDPRLFPLDLRIQHFDFLTSTARTLLLKSVPSPTFLPPIGISTSWLPSTRSILGQSWLRTSGVWGRPTLRKQKVSVSRSGVFHTAEILFHRHATSPLQLDIFFTDEPGTGSGPTTEFYTLLSHEFQKHSLNMWRGDKTEAGFVVSPTGLYPDFIQQHPPAVQQGILRRFMFFGRFVGRALREWKVLDLQLNPVFIQQLYGPGAIQDPSQALQQIDPDFERSLRHISTLATQDDGEAAIESLGLDFTFPGHEDVPLTPNGAAKPLTAPDVPRYIDLVRRMYLKKGVEAQVKAFMQGMQEVFPTGNLRLFSPEELQVLICGKQYSDERIWGTAQCLVDDIVCDHGYTLESDPVQQLIEVVAEMTVKEQQDFLAFISGSPKMPLGGLVPKITIVRRGAEFDHFKEDPGTFLENPLPSVNTCFHYLKLPPYASKAVLKEKLIFAIREGQGSFDLS